MRSCANMKVNAYLKRYNSSTRLTLPVSVYMRVPRRQTFPAELEGASKERSNIESEIIVRMPETEKIVQ